MALGQRSNANGDVLDSIFGDTDGSDNFMAGLPFTRRRKRRKSRKRHTVRGKRTQRKRRKTRSYSSRSKRNVRKSGKRKGMSKEFLRNLRRKHGLGEFKKR